MTSPVQTFDDEFNGNSLNTSLWRSGMDYAPKGSTASDLASWEVGDPSYVPADANPVSVSGGLLSLAIKPTPADANPGSVGNQPFIGGELTTKGLFSQTYGYFEATAKMPAGQGAIGAFWLLPEDGSWPPELDVAEILGSSPTTDINTAHSAAGGTNTANPHWSNIPDATAGEHTYGVDWEADRITWYFDGKQTAQEATPSDMNKPMYMVLDTQAGASGSWIGQAQPGLNTSMQVDSVRVYASNPYAGGNAPAAAAADLSVAASSDSVSASISTLTLGLSEDAWKGNTQFIVSVDGKALNSATEVTALHDKGDVQDFSFSGVAAGAHDVAITFTNDAWGGSADTDRNLWVGRIDLAGQHLAPDSALFGTGTQHFTLG